MNFLEKLNLQIDKTNSLVCVGLDCELTKLPKHLLDEENPQLEFNKAIIDATKDLVCAYKPNSAFYEAQGEQGMEALAETIDYIPEHIPVILDSKRGDIGNTSRLYAQACFEILKADAITVHPYMGIDSVQPFLDYVDKATFILVKTSNPSAVEFEDLEMGGKKLYELVAEKVAEWSQKFPGLAGAVIGATYPEDLAKIRSILPNVPFLIPGLGKQGGSVEETLKNGVDKDKRGLIINSSRGIIFASTGEDFAEKAREETIKFRDSINTYR